MSGILQTCPRCGFGPARLIYDMTAKQTRCTLCLDLSDADLHRRPPTPTEDPKDE